MSVDVTPADGAVDVWCSANGEIDADVNPITQSTLRVTQHVGAGGFVGCSVAIGDLGGNDYGDLVVGANDDLGG